MKRKIILSVLFVLILNSSFLITECIAQWIQTNGPYGGDIPCFAVSGPNIFAGSNGGIFLSTNNGTNWTAVNNGLTHHNLTEYISALAVSGTNIFAGTNGSGPGSGVFLSTNNGTSWTPVNNGLTSQRISALAVSGSNLIAGTDGGVFLSTNNGTNWTVKNNGLTNLNVATLSVSGNNIFAGTNGGIFLSTNNGTNWAVKNSGLTNLNVVTISISGTNIFAGTDGGVFLSTNNGTNWIAKNNGLTTLYVQAFAINGSNFFAGTRNGIFLSTNNGTSWTAKNNGLANPNIQALIASGTMIFAGTATGFNCGLFLSANNGTSWTAVNNGLTGLYIPTLAVNGTNLFAGTDGGGVFLSTNNGSIWIPVNNGLTNQYIYALTFSGTKLFAGGPLGGLYLSTNNGTSWSTVNNGIMPHNVYSLAASGSNIFAGTDAGGIFLSTNNGTSWTAVNNGLTNLNISSIAISGTNIFAGSFGGGIFLSTNNGTSWTEVNNGLTYLYINTLAVSGTKIFTGTFGAGVYLSTNNGTNWIETGLTNQNVMSFAVSGINLFAGTDDGIYLSNNNGSNWFNLNQGFNFVPSVGALLIGNNYILGGTNGYSIWKRPLSDLLSLQAPSNLTYDRTNNRLLWTLSPSYNVEKYLVYKKGSDNIWKSVVDSGGMLNSNINYYNIQTSGFNYYKVGAVSNTGDTAKCDSVYVKRGFVLRKWNSNTIESFKVNKHGFRFGNHETLTNGEPLLWNSFWYSQFNYQNPPYPFFNIHFLYAKSADYPDWPLFTNVYGRNKCYLYYFRPGNILDSSFLRKSVAKWSNIKYYPITQENPLTYNWRGTCLGFSVSSLLAFYKNSTFYSQFPIMNNVDSAYGLLPSTEVKRMINHLQQTQQFNGTGGRYVEPPDPENQTPTIVLNLLVSRFSKISTFGKLNEILCIYDFAGGGHAVVPYAIENINESIKYLYIYDNEYPAVDTVKLIINTTANTCFHNMNNNEIKSMLLLGSLESCLGEQSFDKANQDYLSRGNPLNDSLIYFNATNSSSLYLNRNGDTISGFRITDNSFLGNKSLGFSPMTDGRVNPPIYYKIPCANYLKVIFKDFISSRQTSFLSFDYDSTTTYKIERMDSVQSNQSDIYFLDSSYLSFTNSNTIQKKIYMSTIITENIAIKKEKTFDIDNFRMMLNDTVLIKKSEDKLVLKSKGAAKIYTLRLNYIDTSGNKSFFNPSIFISANTTHIISPVWDSIKTKPVKIFVDLGNNGTIDDTLLISDTVLIKINSTNIEIPDKYSLYQNYPNPFNSVTKISFDVPKSAQLSIRIYDVLGREIECLINEYVQPGKYNINYNANNLASGVYFYRLQAGDYINIKRMVLLK